MILRVRRSKPALGRYTKSMRCEIAVIYMLGPGGTQRLNLSKTRHQMRVKAELRNLWKRVEANGHVAAGTSDSPVQAHYVKKYGTRQHISCVL